VIRITASDLNFDKIIRKSQANKQGKMMAVRKILKKMVISAVFADAACATISSIYIWFL